MMADFVGQLSLLEILAKTSVVLLAVAAARLILTRASAATAHFVQALGFAAVLAVPIAIVALPSLDLPLLDAPTGAESARENEPAERGVPLEVVMTLDDLEESAPAAAGGAPSSAASSNASSLASRIPWVALLWVIGFVAVASRSAVGWLRMKRLSGGARPVDSKRIVAVAEECRDRLGLRTWPRMLIGHDVRVPMLWGFIRPTLLLPESVRDWSEDRLRVVLLHELAHLRRVDGLTLLLGRLATAMHWFNPLAWAVESRARRDCERACDDVVLECGERPSEYARHLLAIASGLPEARRERAAALAISNHFEGRVRSILHPALRRGLGRRGAIAALVCCVLAVGFVSSARLVAEEPEEETSSFQLAQNYREQQKHEQKKELEPGQREFEKAYKLHSAERFEEAIELFGEALDQGYRPSASTYNIACGYARLGRTDEAIEWLERALDDGFDGGYLFKDSDLDPIRSDAAFRELLDRVATEDDTGQAELHRDRFEKTNMVYDALVEKNSENGKAWFKVGSDLLSLRELERAIDALERARRYLGVGNSSALYNLACAYSLAGQTRPALDNLEQAVLAGFDSEERFENDSDLDVLRSSPEFAEIRELHRRLSLQHFEFKKQKGDRNGSDDAEAMWTPAVEEFTAFTRENPDVGRGWYNLGWAQLHSGRHSEAADAFARAGELGFNPATSSYNAACAHALSGQTGAALDWLERAVDAGFSSYGHMATDDDLESLHGNPRFEKILEDGGWDEEQALEMKMKMKMKKEQELQKKLEYEYRIRKEEDRDSV
jgi:beta-lactamase regulating signal transducer with metallopeptidase domain/Tfp pilus assembly protein PilF